LGKVWQNILGKTTFKILLGKVWQNILGKTIQQNLHMILAQPFFKRLFLKGC